MTPPTPTTPTTPTNATSPTEPTKYALFGAYLSALRKSRGLKLGDLGTDRANIHRLERGESRPNYETVDKLVTVLRATPEEATELFERAGYRAPIWPTTPEDFQAIYNDLRADGYSDAPPAALVTDVYWNVWHVNKAFADVFTICQPAALVGQHVLSLMLDPAVGFIPSLSRIAAPADIHAFLLAVVWRYRRRLELNQGGISAPHDPALVHQLPGFAELWQAAGIAGPVPGAHVSVLTRIWLHGGGQLSVHTGIARRDRRFLFTEYIPADQPSAALLTPLLRP